MMDHVRRTLMGGPFPFPAVAALALAAISMASDAGAAGTSGAGDGTVVDGAANCAVQPKTQATWAEAREACAGAGAALPVIQTPRHNSDLQALVRDARWPQASQPPAAWIGLTDRDGVPVRAGGGGWQWVDGRGAAVGSVGRAPSNMTEAMILRAPYGQLVGAEVTYHPGYHNWKPGMPASGAPRGCAAMEAASGQWVARACEGAVVRHAVVCCTPPTPDQFICSAGVAEGADEWPLVPFYYHDDPAADDIPNCEKTVAKGFRTRNACVQRKEP